MVHEKVEQVQDDLKQNKKPNGQRTIYHELFTNDQLPPEEKTANRLEAEGVGLVGAGLVFLLLISILELTILFHLVL